MPESGENTTDLEQNIVIPLENRLSRLGYVEINGEDMTALGIANEIDTYENWVIRKVKEFDITPDSYGYEMRGQPTQLYSQLILELMRDERQWQEHYKSLPSHVSAYVIAESIGRSYGWTRKTLDELGIKYKISKDERKSFLFPKSSAKRLREIDLATPIDDGWITLGAISKATGKDREWIERRLSNEGIHGEPRRNVISGRVFAHYPPYSIEAIAQIAQERPHFGGEWLTAYRISCLIPEKSETWVYKILNTEFSEIGEVRQDDSGVDRVHYPPEVFTNLQNRAQELSKIKQSGNYLTKSDIERKLGKSGLWVANRLNAIGFVPETRIDKVGNARPHYPPSVVNKLTNLPIDVLTWSKKTNPLVYATAIALAEGDISRVGLNSDNSLTVYNSSKHRISLQSKQNTI